MQVAIVSDTHIPSRRPAVPEWVLEAVRAADHVVHAGDFDSPEAYDRIADAAADLTAVAGNMDPPALGLPEVETVRLGGVEFVVVHGTGPLRGYEDRVADVVQEHGGPDAVGVAGHTHDPLDTRVQGVRLLNPGSATGADPATETSILVADCEDGALDASLRRE
jgi:putative phosphoesterase